jgi:tetratricopeptide (TPR) repeat protein
LAQTVLEQLIKLEPDYWDAYYRLGTVLIAKGEVDQGQSYLRNVLQNEPNHWAAEEIQNLLD